MKQDNYNYKLNSNAKVLQRIMRFVNQKLYMK